MPRREPGMPTAKDPEDEKENERKVEIIIKQPEAIEKDPEKETEIYNAWHNEGISSLMEIATKYENETMRWLERHKDEEINAEQKNNIEEYRKAIDIVNKKIEEVYGEMEGVKIEDIKVVIAFKEF